MDNSEKQLLTNLLRDDAGIADRVNAQLSWRQVLYVFMDRRIYLYALINVGTSGVLKFLSAALPSLVKDMSSTEAEIYLMTAPPYASALVCCLLVSYSASRRNEHGFHLIFSLSVALLGFILMLTLINRGKVALYVSLCITFSGIFSALPLLLSWLTNNVGGHTKRSIAIGFVVGIGQTGGIISPFVRLLLLLLINNYFILFVGF